MLRAQIQDVGAKEINEKPTIENTSVQSFGQKQEPIPA